MPVYPVFAVGLDLKCGIGGQRLQGGETAIASKADSAAQSAAVPRHKPQHFTPDYRRAVSPEWRITPEPVIAPRFARTRWLATTRR
jgi:hypothetical protein